MTRFLYLADTHLGANPMGYQQQKGYPEKLPEILIAIREYLQADGDIDFVMHGGDIVDATSANNIITAAKGFGLPVPVHLCLGNHDLTTTDAVEQWLERAPQFFINGKPDYTIATSDCVIHVTPNHWCEEPFFWQDKQVSYLSPSQKERLSHELSIRCDVPHIVLTHSPVYGLPVEQTGLSEPYHCPTPSFTADLTALARAHANLKCILGAHNHMNMRVSCDGVEFVTVSALVETPFEFKLFEVNPQQMEMSTIALSAVLPFEGEYDVSKSFVQGRVTDRSLSRELRNTHDKAHRTKRCTATR